jgi:hypothetical protein
VVWRRGGKKFMSHKRFSKSILHILKCAENVVAELEMGKGSRRGKVLCLPVKYWFESNRWKRMT